MPQVDDAAVVEFALVGAVHLGDVVMPVAGDEAEVAPGVKPAPEMLREALAGLARLDDVAADPEPLQPRGAVDRRAQRVECRELRRVGDVPQVAVVQPERIRRRPGARTPEVRAPAVRGREGDGAGIACQVRLSSVAGFLRNPIHSGISDYL